MLIKSLVSIYFSGNRIKVSELDAKKKTVKVCASVDLAEGIIEKNRIVDKAKLAEILKLLWHKNSIRTKDVGIIIPEFSTFTKLLTLPKLAPGELNEAVIWQAQEYLPVAIEKLVIDWKMVKRDESGVEAFLVAVPKDVLMEYVEVAVMAGLFPMSVEIPSVSLGNLISENAGFMAIYRGQLEALLMVGVGNKILGTSVVPNSQQDEILTTVARIIKHFNKADIKCIFVGGEVIDQKLVESLASEFKLKISVLDPKVKGISPADVQKYLIPISMQKGAIAEPSDITTLNLLPPALVDKYKRQKAKIQVWSLTLTVTLFVWICFLVVVGTFLTLSQQISQQKIKNREKTAITGELQKFQTESGKINSIALNIKNIRDNTFYPQTILNLINATKPQGITLNQYEIDIDKNIVSFKGVAADRNSLITFKNNLEASKDIENLDFPVSSFEAETNASFKINFAYKPISSTVKKATVPKVN